MHDVIQKLLKLQVIEFGEKTGKNVEAEAAELRGQIPAQIIGHYDRLRARDKKGVAVVRNQVCTGCHMRLPIGKITVLMRDEDIQLCDSCGRYLYIEPAAAPAPAAEAPAPAADSAEAPKKPRAPRKRKAKEAQVTV
jgi:predicted  nucleic acid-binding Zn-ribbon protein